MIVNPEIERYMLGLLPLRDEVLAEMEEVAARRNVPIIGPTVARILAQLVMATGAKRIFELGSAFGYSTIWLARAAGKNAEVHYTDGSPDNAREAQRYFDRAGVSSVIQVHVGDALASLAQVRGEFDLIFNDVDKEGYPLVLETVPPRLKTGGLFVTDNTLWHEAILNPREPSDKAVADFNQKLYNLSQFFTTLLPIRDGVCVSLKL